MFLIVFKGKFLFLVLVNDLPLVSSFALKVSSCSLKVSSNIPGRKVSSNIPGPGTPPASGSPRHLRALV